jgi:hypothetical protein
MIPVLNNTLEDLVALSALKDRNGELLNKCSK